MCAVRTQPGVPAPGATANSGERAPEHDQAIVRKQHYVGQCIECGRSFMLYYETTRPISHVLDIVPVLCPTCEEKMQWQEVRI